METQSSSFIQKQEFSTVNRRTFFENGMKIALAGGLAGMSFLSACTEKEEKESEGQKVSPPEDLMQEHGVLKRILLIYDTCRIRLSNKISFPTEAVSKSATIIRTFIEDYHEKLEEDFLFPRFQKANQLTELVNVLLQQHQAGRKITDEIIQLSSRSNRSNSENERLIQLLLSFNTMYNPHEAREDTVLFPAFRKLVSKNEYDSLGEEFEKKEHTLFGEEGFEKTVEQVAGIEKMLGIYDLAQFTPKV